MIKNMINIVICDLLPMERAREREREQKTSLPPFLSFLLRLFVAGYATNFKKYGVPLLLHESQLGQTVQTSSFWWTKNGWPQKQCWYIFMLFPNPKRRNNYGTTGGCWSLTWIIITLEDSEVLHAHFGNVKERSTPQVRQRGYLLSLAALGAVLLFNASSSCWGWLELRILRFNWFGFYWQHTQKWQS